MFWMFGAKARLSGGRFEGDPSRETYVDRDQKLRNEMDLCFRLRIVDS